MANWGQKTYPTFVGKQSHEKGPSIVRYCPLLSSNICMAPSYESSQVYYVVFPFANRCETCKSNFTQNLSVLGLLEASGLEGG